MNTLNKLLTSLALVVVALTSAFSSLPADGGCDVFGLFLTLFTNQKPCGFAREEIVGIMTEYVSEIVEDVVELSVYGTPTESAHTITPTNVSTPFAASTLSSPIRPQQNTNVVSATPLPSTEDTNVPEPTITLVPTIVSTETLVPATETLQPTIESIITDAPEPTETATPEFEITIDETPTAEHTPESPTEE